MKSVSSGSAYIIHKVPVMLVLSYIMSVPGLMIFFMPFDFLWFVELIFILITIHESYKVYKYPQKVVINEKGIIHYRLNEFGRSAKYRRIMYTWRSMTSCSISWQPYLSMRDLRMDYRNLIITKKIKEKEAKFNVPLEDYVYFSANLYKALDFYSPDGIFDYEAEWKSSRRHVLKNFCIYVGLILAIILFLTILIALG